MRWLRHCNIKQLMCFKWWGILLEAFTALTCKYVPHALPDSRSLRMGGAFSTAVKPNSVVVPVVSDPCAFCSQYRQRLCFACTRASAAAPKPFLDPQLLITSSRDYNDAMSQCLLLWLAAYRAAATRASHRDKDKIFCHRVCNRSFVRIDRHCEKQLGRASCW